MNLHSLTSKITLIFLFAFLCLIAFFIFYSNHSSRSLDKEVSQKYKTFSTYFREAKIANEDIEAYLNNFGFEKISHPHTIIKDKKVIKDGRGFQALLFKGKYYYFVQRRGYHTLFKDLNRYTQKKLEYVGFTFVLLLLCVIYFWLLNSLKPLRTLQSHIAQFAEGNLDITCHSDKKDEIAMVANEFHNAVQEIKLLLSSRQLFLRTVMHELKTPIAKGTIVTSLVDDDIQQKRLRVIFEKLEYLIDDFAKVEEVVSGNYTLNRQNYRVRTIVENAIEMLLLENIERKVRVDTKENPRIHADFTLLSMAIKNLIDNGIKYSNKQVEVLIDAHTIQVISQGEKLNKPLEAYFKPFHNEANILNQGMGLGLYIVKSILDMHDMRLEYHYLNGKNIFGFFVIQKKKGIASKERSSLSLK